MARLTGGRGKLTINDLISRQDLREILTEFTESDLQHAEKLLIIWADADGVHSRYSGFSDMEIIGALSIVQNDLITASNE